MGNQVTMKSVHARYLTEYGRKLFRFEDSITQSKNFKTFYDDLESTVNTNITIFKDIVYINGPKISSLKYKRINDLRIVCDIVFKKDYCVGNFEMIGYYVFVNITEYVKDEGWYAIDDDGDI